MSRADEHFERNEWLVSRLPKFKKIMVVAEVHGSDRLASDGDADDSSVSFSAQSLQQSLKNLPQVRPEKVAQASALAADASYPSDAALNQLAGFLARRL